MKLIKRILEIDELQQKFPQGRPGVDRFDIDHDHQDPDQMPDDGDEGVEIPRDQWPQQEQRQHNSASSEQVSHAATKLEAAVRMLQNAGDNVIQQNIISAMKDLGLEMPDETVGESMKVKGKIPSMKPRNKSMNDALLSRKSGAHYDAKKDYVRSKEKTRVQKERKQENE